MRHTYYLVRSWWRWKVNRKLWEYGLDPAAVWGWIALLTLGIGLWALVIWGIGRLLRG